MFGFETLLDTDRLVALNVAGMDVLILFKKGAPEDPATLPGGVIPGHGASGRSHLAFSIAAEDIEPWRERLAGEGRRREHRELAGRRRATAPGDVFAVASAVESIVGVAN